MIFPDRISALIQQIEAGQPVTQSDVDRTATLQSLDLAKLGEDFARQFIAADDALTADLGKAAASG